MTHLSEHRECLPTARMNTTAQPIAEVLNLGCGRSPIDGAINLDIWSGPRVDVVHDLRQFPWPFAKDTFSRIHCIDILEHLPDTVATMEEIHRISKPDGVVEIVTPHFTCANAFTDPTHWRQFGFFSFDYFTGQATHNQYTNVRFAYRKRTLIFHPSRKNSLVRRFANRRPAFYERHLGWVLPAWFISVELVVLK
jgi:predicted SAM-dependent methyltransferase